MNATLESPALPILTGASESQVETATAIRNAVALHAELAGHYAGPDRNILAAVAAASRAIDWANTEARYWLDTFPLGTITGIDWNRYQWTDCAGWERAAALEHIDHGMLAAHVRYRRELVARYPEDR